MILESIFIDAIERNGFRARKAVTSYDTLYVCYGYAPITSAGLITEHVRGMLIFTNEWLQLGRRRIPLGNPDLMPGLEEYLKECDKRIWLGITIPPHNVIVSDDLRNPRSY